MLSRRAIKVKKVLSYIATAAFLLALIGNLSVETNLPISYESNIAVADTTTSDSTSTNNSSAGVWRKIVTECTAKKTTYKCCPPSFTYEDVPGHTLSCCQDGDKVRCVPHSCIMGSTCTQE